MTTVRSLLRRLVRRPSSGVMYALLGVLLLSTVVLSRMVWQQTSTLETSVELTGETVNANVRTAGQTQRELLRLETALLADELDLEQVELLRSFVTQRMGEMVLPYHRAALGTDDLLAQAEVIESTWSTDVEPAVAAFASDPGMFTPAARRLLVEDIAGLELAVNTLAADAEIHRRTNAGRANDAAVDVLDGTRVLLVGLIAMLTGFVVVAALVVFTWRRMARQREHDLSEQMTLATEVRTLSQVASSTDNMVIVTDAAGRTEWVNDAFTRTTGYTLDDVLGIVPGDVLQGPDTDPATIATMREALAAGEGFNVEIVNYTVEGYPYWVELDVQPVRGEDGRIEHFIAVQSDITERREMEERLVAARDAAEELAHEKAMFLASMSHEIRTPLNAVIGLSGMLLDTDLDDQQRQYAMTARRSGTLLLELINNILSFSALEAGKVELERRPADLRALVAETCELFTEQAVGKGIDLAWTVDDDVADQVRTDPTRLRQVLVNLLGNAVKFTDAGTVRVEVTAAGGEEVGFRVVDSGVGVPDEVRARLFQPFTQADSSTSRTHGGTGLGLAISRHLVELLGGTVRIEDGVDGGTCFCFTVEAPAVQAAATRRIGDPGDATIPQEVRILLAEDDAVNQIVAVHMLGQLGHAVDVVADGHAVLEAIAATAYDVVLMDIHMPGLDGVATTQRIRTGVPPSVQPRIIAMTANALEGDRERFLASGMDGYVSKPVSLQALRKELARVLALPSLTEA